MVICIVALVVFAVMGIFSARYRDLAKESFDCVFRTVTLRPCRTNLDQRIKSKVTAKLMGRFPKVAGFVYRNYGIISWIFVVLFFATLFLTIQGLFNLYVYGNCNGPAGGFCIFAPNGGAQPTPCPPNVTAGTTISP